MMLIAGCRGASAQTNFIRVTNSVLTAELVTGSGAAWADYDGDGWLDLAQANFNGPNLVFHNEGGGIFTKVANTSVAIAGPESYGVAWGDFDNDGRPDLFFGNGYVSGAANLLFHNRSAVGGSFLRILEGPGSTALISSSVGCSWADYDRDGFLDLFVANSGTPSELWHNKGNGSFERVLTGAVVTNIAYSIGAAWADYNNDGWPDLFVANGLGAGSNQRNFLYRNNGDGTFTQIKTGRIVNDLDQFLGAAWGDYDNDGFLDLLTVGDYIYLYHNNGDDTFTRVTEAGLEKNSGIFISAAWADYDNDGWLDLFVGNRSPGAGNFLYHNSGNGTFAKVLTGPIVDDRYGNGGCAWADYDDDGLVDLFVSGTDIGAPNTGHNALYHNQGTTNKSLKIRLHATRSNASAIGAKVRLAAIINGKAFTQIREINTGDGLAGNSQEALFGLGDANAAVSVLVEWPSGVVSSSPVPVQSGAQDIWESQPLSLRIGGVAQAPSFDKITVELTRGDPTQYYVSGDFTTGITVMHRAYELEISDDLLHWSRYVGDSDRFFVWPPTVSNRYELSVDHSSRRFIRAREAGFVLRSVGRVGWPAE